MLSQEFLAGMATLSTKLKSVLFSKGKYLLPSTVKERGKWGMGDIERKNGEEE